MSPRTAGTNHWLVAGKKKKYDFCNIITLFYLKVDEYKAIVKGLHMEIEASQETSVCEFKKMPTQIKFNAFEPNQYHEYGENNLSLTKPKLDKLIKKKKDIKD